MNNIKILIFDIFKNIIIIIFYTFRIYSLNIAINEYKIPKLIIEKELIKKSKYLKLFGKNLFFKKDLEALKKKLKKKIIFIK